MGLFDLDNKFMKDYLKDYTNYSNWYGNTIRAEPMIDKNSIKKHLDGVWDALFTRLDKKYKKNLFIAGGCFQSLALNEQVNDYDIWATDNNISREIHDVILKQFSNSITETKKSIYFYAGDYQINYVKQSFGTPTNTIKAFDFHHAMCYYSGEGELFLSDSLGKKELLFNTQCANAVGSVYRLKKFIGRGYTIKRKEINKIFKKALEHISERYCPDGSDEIFEEECGDYVVTKEDFELFVTFYQL